MGIYDQGLWLLSQFSHDTITVRGLPLFGHHLNFAMTLLVPPYWLGAGPHFLNLLQAGSLALGAVPLYLLARERLRDAWAAVALGATYLFHPTTQFLQVELFHPDTMAITPLLVAYWASVRHRWGWYGVAAVLAVAWKEDVAVAVAVLGLVVALRGEWRIGLGTTLIAGGYFLIGLEWLLPVLNRRGVFYSQFFASLGDSFGEVIRTVLTSPSILWERLTKPDAITYLARLTAPLGAVFLAGPAGLVAGLPQLAINVLSDFPYTRDFRFHYSALPLTGLVLGTVEGARWLVRQVGHPRIVAGLLATAALVASLAWGPSGLNREHGGWPQPNPIRKELRTAVELVPPDASVSATYTLVPHLTHRERIYEFPTPWKTMNWGIRDELPHDPRTVEWVVVHTASLNDLGRTIYDHITSSPGTEIAYREGDVVVLHLTEPVGPPPE